MPDNLQAIKELGFNLDGAGSMPFCGIRFIDGGVSVEAPFPNGSGRGVRRIALHRAMLSAAESVGADFEWGRRVTGIFPEGAWVERCRVTARWIVGADGGNSRLRSWAALDRGSHKRARFGFRRHYRIAPWTDYMELYWGRNAQLYVTPTGFEEVCVTVVSRDPHLRVERALNEFPKVVRKLCGVAQNSRELGALTLSRRFPRVTRDRVALIGDASGSVDAITGEGLCLAFRQALALAEALERDNLESYEDAHRRLMRRPAFMAEVLLFLAGQPRFRRRILSAFSARPALFERMLAIHVGAHRPLLNGRGLAWTRLGGAAVSDWLF